MINNDQHGFILTRHSQDKKNGVEITLWIKTLAGAKQLVIENEKAIFFVEASLANKAYDLLKEHGIERITHRPLPLKSFSQDQVNGFYFDFMRDLYSARDLLKQHGIKVYEDDFRPDDRYLMERFITDCTYFDGKTAEKGNYQRITQTKCKKVNADIPLNIVSIDIECAFDGELYSIGLYSEESIEPHSKEQNVECLAEKTHSLVFMIGEEPVNTDVSKNDESSYVTYVRDEKSLLYALIDWIDENDPDIFIGWNVINFDFNLLQKRCDLHGVKFTIGRDFSTPYWRKNKNSEQQFLDIAGRVVLDGIDLLKTATYNFPSFSLDNVAFELLGKNKKVDDVDNRLKEITHNFHHNKTALAEYNLQDCVLVWQIFQHTDLIAFAKLRSKLTGLSIDRVGGSVAAFTNLYLPKLHRAGYVAPNMGDGHSDLVSPGGYVMDSIPGLYKNVLVLDFKSLYPSIIRTFKIDPMGMIEGLKSPENAIAGFDKAYFSRTQHFLPDIINELWQERDKAKKDNNGALSQAIKIIMNSFYGILGSTGCRFFDPRLSGSITKRSHEILKTTQTWIEALGHQVIYGDTDSIFVYIGEEHDESQSRALGKQLQEYINDKWTTEIQQRFNISSQLEIEFETHFLQFFMPTIRGLDIGTKKRYAGVVNDDGNQKIIFKGLESVRTDWTILAKNFQQALYLKVFNGDPVIDYIKDIVAKTRSGELDHQLVYRKRIRRKLSDYQKNIPPHIKAARLAEDKNKQLGKPLRYQNRGWIEYVITINGPQVIEQVDAMLDYEFYIDRQLKSVANAILPFIDLSFEQITDNQLNLFPL